MSKLLKRVVLLIENFFTGNIQIQMAGDNATQIQSSRVDELLKSEGIFILTLSNMQNLLSIFVEGCNLTDDEREITKNRVDELLSGKYYKIKKEK